MHFRGGRQAAKMRNEVYETSGVEITEAIESVQMSLTHSAWTSSERQCCAMMSDGDRQPCPPNVQSPCRVPDQPNEASDVILTGELPPTFWPIQTMPVMRRKRERKLVSQSKLSFFNCTPWPEKKPFVTFCVATTPQRLRVERFVQLPDALKAIGITKSKFSGFFFSGLFLVCVFEWNQCWCPFEGKKKRKLFSHVNTTALAQRNGSKFTAKLTPCRSKNCNSKERSFMCLKSGKWKGWMNI